MEHGPIPPHERTWRHPSELGPTSRHIERTTPFSPHTKALVLASGSLAVILIIAIVVTATPRTSSQPTALSATTLPAFITAPPSSITAPGSIGARTADASFLLASFTPIPNEITSAPQLSIDEPAIADNMPESDESVMVQTEDVTYHCTWADTQWLEMPDGTVVVDGHGDLVARVEAGELIALVAD